MPRFLLTPTLAAAVVLIIGSGIVARVRAADDVKETKRARVRVAAVQINGYDKGDVPREGYNPTQQLLPYIDRAGKEKMDLIVFPEYVLGHIQVPGPSTKAVAAAAAANRVYVIVGCWEEYPDGSFANTALIFDRGGKIAGKYHKTHAAIDHFEGSPPWANPPKGKSKEWFLKNDPEWAMEPGQRLPVFEFDFGKVGIMTAKDHSRQELGRYNGSRELLKQGLSIWSQPE